MSILRRLNVLVVSMNTSKLFFPSSSPLIIGAKCPFAADTHGIIDMG